MALQFPAGLKRQAFQVARTLREEGFFPLISGDPCYGACDLALDLLPHADVLVHFGHAPIGKESDVMFELAPFTFDVQVLEQVLPALKEQRIGLVTTVQHLHLLEAMVEFFRSRGIEAVVAKGSSRTPFAGQILGCSFEAARNTGASEILYVGTGLFHPLGVQLATRVRVLALDPYTGEVQEVDASRLLRRRFALMEKAKGAESIGVIVSQKSGQQRWALAERLVQLSTNAVLVVVHDLCPDELLNLGLDAYVNTSCPRLAYYDQERLPVPVLTPQEYEILRGIRSWEEYSIDEIP